MASVGLRRASPEETPKNLVTSRAWPQLMGCATGFPKCPRQASGTPIFAVGTFAYVAYALLRRRCCRTL
jgi:hypothetical protein